VVDVGCGVRVVGGVVIMASVGVSVGRGDGSIGRKKGLCTAAVGAGTRVAEGRTEGRIVGQTVGSTGRIVGQTVGSTVGGVLGLGLGRRVRFPKGR
jgi:hypothetical protein